MDETNTNANPVVDTTVDTNPQEPVVAEQGEVAEAMPAPETTEAPEAPVEEKPAEEPAQA